MDSDWYTLANNVKTAVDDYTVTATLNDTTNTAWVGGGTGVQEYAFSIEYATIHVTIVGVYGESETILLDNEEVNVGSAIALPLVRWFKTAGAKFNNAIVTTYTADMDNETLTAEYTYAIGAGDADGDGVITAGDVIQMKRFFVGLDASKLVEDAADAWSKKGNDAYANGVLQSALDVNDSGTFRTSDIVAVREALATGYSFKIVIENGVQLVKEAVLQEVEDYATFKEKVLAGFPVKLTADITEDDDFDEELTVPADIDLNGFTLTLNKFYMTNTGAGVTLKIGNGTIVTVDGISITAPNGNVIVGDTTGYVYSGETVTLAAATSSLHFEGDVAFKDYTVDGASSKDEVVLNTLNVEDTNTVMATPTAVDIPVDTHVVVEAAATLTVEQITVIEPMGDDDTVNTFSIEVNNSGADVITVNVTSKVSSDYIVENVNQAGDISKINLVTDQNQDVNTETGVKTAAELVAAIQAANASANGGVITIAANIDFSDAALAGYFWSDPLNTRNPLRITGENITLDLNGHTFSNMGNNAIVVGSIYAADGKAKNVTIKNGTMLPGFSNNSINSYVMHIAADGALIKDITAKAGIGVMTASTDVVIEDCAIEGTKYYAVNSQCGSEVTLKNVTLTKRTDVAGGSKAMFWIQKAGTDSDMATTEDPTGAFGDSTLTIEGGNFTIDTANGGVFYNNGGVKPVVTGGTFNIDPTAYLADGYVATEDNGIWTVTAAE